MQRRFLGALGEQTHLRFFGVFLFVLFCCCAFVPLFLNFFYVVGFSLFIFCNFSCLVYTGILSFYLHCFCFDLYYVHYIISVADV